MKIPAQHRTVENLTLDRSENRPKLTGPSPAPVHIEVTKRGQRSEGSKSRLASHSLFSDWTGAGKGTGYEIIH